MSMIRLPVDLKCLRRPIPIYSPAVDEYQRGVEQGKKDFADGVGCGQCPAQYRDGPEYIDGWFMGWSESQELAEAEELDRTQEEMERLTWGND